jgi:ATP-dependent Zn protease
MSDEFTSAWLESRRVSAGPISPDDIIGIGHVRDEIASVLARLRDPDRVEQAGGRLPRGLLFYGPPGTGKTLTARYLVSALGSDVPMYETSADELSPERIRGAIRYLAEAHPRSVLYVDEIDTFALERDAATHDTRTRQQLVAMLAALDGIVESTGPVVIASSNRPPFFLDRAIVRPGRLGFHLRFGLPDEAEREALFALFSKERSTDGPIDWALAARLTRGRTPAALRQALDDALGHALAAGRSGISNDDVIAAIARNGDIEPERPTNHEEDWVVAVHEAGHAAVGAVLYGPERIYAMKLGPIASSTEFGDQQAPPRFVTATEMASSIAVSYGGWAAERSFFGEPSSGCEMDFASATELTLRRVEAGMEPGFPLVSFKTLGRLVGGALRRRLNDTVVGRTEEAAQLAIAIIEANREGISKLAHALVAEQTLTGDQLAAILADADFRRPEAVDGAA